VAQKFTTSEELDRWFGHTPPSTPEIGQAHEHIRSNFRDLAGFLSELLPECPDKTVALRALREAMYHANACVAVNQRLFAGRTEPDVTGKTAPDVLMHHEHVAGTRGCCGPVNDGEREGDTEHRCGPDCGPDIGYTRVRQAESQHGS
jgi:hypothetical protein